MPSCSIFESEPVTVRFKTMGTEASLTVAGKDLSRLQDAQRQTQKTMERLEAELSVYRTDSVISHLNRQAGVAAVKAPADTVRALELSKTYGDLSGGAFDVTIGPVLELWRFKAGAAPTLPSDEVLRERLGLVDYRRIAIDRDTVFLPIKGMRVDLGGIGKGYAVDAAWRQCRALGFSDFMIDLSGNLRVSGKPASDLAWHIGIRNPFDKSSTVARIRIPDGWAVASSGQYERFVEIEGRRYGHIIDPRTGYPASGLAGVTVLAPDATMADALSTSVFVMGPRASLPVLKRTKAEAVLIPDKEPAELWVTPGIEKLLHGLAGWPVRRLPGS